MDLMVFLDSHIDMTLIMMIIYAQTFMLKLIAGVVYQLFPLHFGKLAMVSGPDSTADVLQAKSGWQTSPILGRVHGTWRVDSVRLTVSHLAVYS